MVSSRFSGLFHEETSGRPVEFDEQPALRNPSSEVHEGICEESKRILMYDKDSNYGKNVLSLYAVLMEIVPTRTNNKTFLLFPA